MSDTHDPLTPHVHDPNPEPPSADPNFTLHRPGQNPVTITIADLNALPQTEIGDCYIVTTSHGLGGPYRFQGVTLKNLIEAMLPAGYPLTQVEVRSGDGFGTRIQAYEINKNPNRPILLATGRNDLPLTRDQGLVRLIVPQETDDALRQVKWISSLTILSESDTIHS